MKRIRIFLAAIMLLSGLVLFGQTEKTVSAMKAGTVLTDGDIGFLSMVANTDLDEDPGNRTVKIDSVVYKVGQKLTAANATSINKAIKAFQKTYKAPETTRGAGLCYYWYYYCDPAGNCAWYKHWYYC